MNPPDNPASRPASDRPSRRTRLLVIALPVLILIGAAVIAWLLLDTRPTAHRAHNKPRTEARLVTVTPAEASPRTVMIAAHGTVEAAQSTNLRARVGGQIIALADNLAPGTRFHKGDVLAHIDPADYRLALTQAKSQLASAQASLATENGQQAVAKRELALVGSQVSARERNLALRGPQLASARADVASARSQVDQAQLDLKRTEVMAPFSGIVTARSASLGDVVSTADTLATLAATDDYWVDVSLPVDQLRWLQAPGGDTPATRARIYYPDAWGDDAYMPASVLRIQGQLEANGRLARVLLQVPHPLGGDNSDGHRLLLGAYVKAMLAATMPAHSVMIDSAYLRENNTVWLLSDQHTLDIHSVKVAYRDNSRAVIAAGLAAGDEVITSDLNAPIQGMPLRVDGGDKQTPPPAASNNGGTRSGIDTRSRRNTASVARTDGLQMAPAASTLVRPGRSRAPS